MFTVALTGGIGSGKSEVAKLFSSLGIPVIDTDLLARELVKPGQPALEEIIQTFGRHLKLNSGELDRSGLAALCFSNATARKQLEAILHPRIRHAVSDQLAQLHSAYALVVIPLLVETNQQNAYDRVLVIDCPPELQLKRVKERDGRSDEQITAILSAQANREDRLNSADDIITNTGNLSDLERQVKALHQIYLTLSQSNR